jgi:hypothetical protein
VLVSAERLVFVAMAVWVVAALIFAAVLALVSPERLATSREVGIAAADEALRGVCIVVADELLNVAGRARRALVIVQRESSTRQLDRSALDDYFALRDVAAAIHPHLAPMFPPGVRRLSEQLLADLTSCGRECAIRLESRDDPSIAAKIGEWTARIEVSRVRFAEEIWTAIDAVPAPAITAHQGRPTRPTLHRSWRRPSTH